MSGPGQNAVLHQSSEDEKGLLGSMLLDPTCVRGVLKVLAPIDLIDLANRAVFASIARRYGEADGDGQALATMVLADIKGHPAVDDGRGLLLEIHKSVVTAAHASTYTKAVQEASLRRQIADIATTATAGISSQQGAATILNNMHADCDSLLRKGGAAGGIKKYDLADLIHDFPSLNPPVVDGLFREGETANLIAASKVGKSWMVYGLALSIIHNERWLGRFDVSPGRVLLIDNELHPNVLASRLQTVADAMGIEIDSVWRDLDIWPLRGNLRSLQELGDEFERIEPGEYKAIILDAKYRFAAEGVSENDNAAETLNYNLIDRYAARTKAAFVLVHHASKGSQTDKAVTDVGSGAGAQSRATDCHMVLRPHEEDGCAVLDAAVRSFPPINPVPLRWAFPVWISDQHLDPAKLANRLGKGQQAKAAEDQADKQLIVQKLSEADGPLSTRKVREATGFGKDKTERLLFALVADGVVVSSEGTVGHNKCTVYSLAPNGGGTGGTRVVGPPGASVPGGGGWAAPKGGPTTHPPDPGTPDTYRPGGVFPEFAGHAEGSL